MTGFLEKECEGCERCGAFIPKTLVQWHKCLGTDLTKRPANVPVEVWLAQQRPSTVDLLKHLLDGRSDGDRTVEMSSSVMRESRSPPRIAPEKPRWYKNAKAWAEPFLALSLLWILLSLLWMLWPLSK